MTRTHKTILAAAVALSILALASPAQARSVGIDPNGIWSSFVAWVLGDDVPKDEPPSVEVPVNPQPGSGDQDNPDQRTRAILG